MWKRRDGMAGGQVRGAGWEVGSRDPGAKEVAGRA